LSRGPSVSTWIGSVNCTVTLVCGSTFSARFAGTTTGSWAPSLTITSGDWVSGPTVEAARPTCCRTLPRAERTVGPMRIWIDWPTVNVS
jgi:hypothetical protein